MMWKGYATKHLNIILRPLQLKALEAYHERRDSIIIQATGSGKSTCFSLPTLLLSGSQQGLIVVPTLALGEDYQFALKQFNIHSFFLNASYTKKDYESALNGSFSSVFIMTPEFLFGQSAKGIVDRIEKDRFAYIVIDEAHLVFNWSSFRSSFSRMKELQFLFSCQYWRYRPP